MSEQVKPATDEERATWAILIQEQHGAVPLMFRQQVVQALDARIEAEKARADRAEAELAALCETLDDAFEDGRHSGWQDAMSELHGETDDTGREG